MKPIERKELIQLKNRVVLPSPPEEFDLDEREPMEVVADRLMEFAESMRQLSQNQSQEVTKVLKLILGVLESIGKPEPIKVDVDVTEKRLTAWDVQVVKRDKTGKIKQIKITGEPENGKR